MKDSREIINSVLSDGRTELMENESKLITSKLGIPTTKFEIAKSPEEAVRIAERMGFPVVLKILSPQILHKTDVGCVKLNLANENDIIESYEEIIKNARNYTSDAEIYGVIVEEFAKPGHEVIVGGLYDPQFGQCVMFGGLGGIFVEVLKDVSFRVAPITEYDALEMIEETKGYLILKGIRGQPPADTDSIVDILLKTSQLMMDFPEIDQLDLNPIFVYEKRNGAICVDARIILNPTRHE